MFGGLCAGAKPQILWQLKGAKIMLALAITAVGMGILITDCIRQRKERAMEEERRERARNCFVTKEFWKVMDMKGKDNVVRVEF